MPSVGRPDPRDPLVTAMLEDTCSALTSAPHRVFTAGSVGLGISQEPPPSTDSGCRPRGDGQPSSSCPARGPARSPPSIPGLPGRPAPLPGPHRTFVHEPAAALLQEPAQPPLPAALVRQHRVRRERHRRAGPRLAGRAGAGPRCQGAPGWHRGAPGLLRRRGRRCLLRLLLRRRGR